VAFSHTRFSNNLLDVLSCCQNHIDSFRRPTPNSQQLAGTAIAHRLIDVDTSDTHTVADRRPHASVSRIYILYNPRHIHVHTPMGVYPHVTSTRHQRRRHVRPVGKFNLSPFDLHVM